MELTELLIVPALILSASLLVLTGVYLLVAVGALAWFQVKRKHIQITIRDFEDADGGK